MEVTLYGGKPYTVRLQNISIHVVTAYRNLTRNALILHVKKFQKNQELIRSFSKKKEKKSCFFLYLKIV